MKPEELEIAFKLANPMDMTEQVAYHIWAAVATSTKAFGNVRIKVDSRNCRVYLGVNLRWWAKTKKLSLLHGAWLQRAESRVKDLIPSGWRFLIYYEQANRTAIAGKGHDDESGVGDAIRQGGSTGGNSEENPSRSKVRTGKADREVSS